jgi:hypothetical protein
MPPAAVLQRLTNAFFARCSLVMLLTLVQCPQIHTLAYIDFAAHFHHGAPEGSLRESAEWCGCFASRPPSRRSRGGLRTSNTVFIAQAHVGRQPEFGSRTDRWVGFRQPQSAHPVVRPAPLASVSVSRDAEHGNPVAHRGELAAGCHRPVWANPTLQSDAPLSAWNNRSWPNWSGILNKHIVTVRCRVRRRLGDAFGR